MSWFSSAAGTAAPAAGVWWSDMKEGGGKDERK
jgi:hypothetical protein